MANNVISRRFANRLLCYAFTSFCLVSNLFQTYDHTILAPTRHETVCATALICAQFEFVSLLECCATP
jgi:hypothetical protein